ncbi:hypothetical protein BT93_A0235 [Corymbia citriodora subsp. variegata]|nr:hypothetical protein BT93_A0235 [Corymbia citriodora subsp. variegata]KAF8041576.1 hypothetical protein BT93_A0235 [Corymbia citriodora subsp. variegata]
MLNCMKSRHQLVLPIFYKVEPTQLRHLTGSFGAAINEHKKKLDEIVVKEWEEALKEVGFLKGWESDKVKNGYEGKLVEIVVRKIICELKKLSQLITPEHLVGIDDHVERVMSLIDTNVNDKRIIGIYGFGGIGKTTLAKVLYNKLSGHFKHLSFVANIRETSQHKGIKCLQEQLIYSILRSRLRVSNVDEGIGFIKSRFERKKVLILLDDIDNRAHLNALVGDGSWFKAGSRVIVTTRNKSILNEAYMYQLNELSLDQSLILFSRHAFRKDSPQSDYHILSRKVVSTTGGLPLALEVIGSFLCGREKKVWKDTLKKLKKAPDEKVQTTLRISYEALGWEVKQIFLDIACLFIGSSKQSPTYMWDAYDFFPENGLEVLCLMSLIKIDKDSKLIMHDQLRDFGREIVRQENQMEPQRRSRLWIYEEAINVLDNNKGTGKIEAIRLDNCGCGRSYMGESFKELTNLRFLQVNTANLVGDFLNLLPQLRWLQWVDCPSDFTATNFHPRKLVVLDLSWSGISEDWRGWCPLKMATELKVLNLLNCRSMSKTPDLSAFKSLEIFLFEGCCNLQEIHPSIGDIKTLVSLNVKSCKELKELPAGVGRLEELSELILDHTDIQEIPVSRGCLMKLETLSASSCGRLAQLPESIGYLKALKTLNASNCASLACIPSSIGHLASLQCLLLWGCPSLRQIPDSIGKLESLAELRLANTSIAELSESIGNLHNLRILDIRQTHITELPSAIGMLAKLQELRASGCKNLEGLPSNMGKLVSLNNLKLGKSGIIGLPESISKLSSVRKLSVRCCQKLRELPELPSSITALHITCQSRSLPHLSQLNLLKKLALSDCPWLEYLPKLPIGLSMLSITRCGKLKAVTDLLNLKHLSELYLEECYELTQVTGLEDLQQSLYNLRVRECPNISWLDGTESCGSSSSP